MSTAGQSNNPQEILVAGLRDLMVQNLRREFEATKRTIAAIPEEGRHYRPDAKARTAQELAWHIASSQIRMLTGAAELNLSFPREEQQDEPKTVSAIVQWYQERFSPAVERVTLMTASELLTILTFRGGVKLPAFQCLIMAHNHCIHHRGQLSTYLRPMGSKVPSIYGGSADEPFQP